MGAIAEIGSSCLLFTLVFGMSATVNMDDLRVQLRNKSAILTGIFLQFIILPFLGFAAVNALDMTAPMGVALMVVTSSPGGSYSNWWCSMFNADLALSVTMTAISTLMSVIMLPLNLVIYTANTFDDDDDVVNNLDFASLFVALAVVIGAIGTGLLCSAKVHSHRFNLYANKIGNIAGITLVLISILASSQDKNARLWDRDWKFYLGVGCPCVLGLVLANIISTSISLKKPERVTVSVECCYQNTGIATSVALAMFTGDDLAEALSVPLYYGLVEAITLGIYCLTAWKIGWTKAPADESFCVVITSSYEVQKSQLEDVNAIEVVLGVPKEGVPSDLIFEIDGVAASARQESAMSETDCNSSTIYAVSYPASSVEERGRKEGGENWDEEQFMYNSPSLSNNKTPRRDEAHVVNGHASIEMTEVKIDISDSTVREHDLNRDPERGIATEADISLSPDESIQITTTGTLEIQPHAISPPTPPISNDNHSPSLEQPHAAQSKKGLGLRRKIKKYALIESGSPTHSGLRKDLSSSQPDDTTSSKDSISPSTTLSTMSSKDESTTSSFRGNDSNNNHSPGDVPPPDSGQQKTTNGEISDDVSSPNERRRPRIRPRRYSSLSQNQDDTPTKSNGSPSSSNDDDNHDGLDDNVENGASVSISRTELKKKRGKAKKTYEKVSFDDDGTKESSPRLQLD